MYWQIMWVVWALMPATFSIYEQYEVEDDEDYSNYDEEEEEEHTAFSAATLKNFTRVRRSDLNGSTSNEYDETDIDYIPPQRAAESPTSLLIAFIHSTLNIQPMRSSTHKITATRSSSQPITTRGSPLTIATTLTAEATFLTIATQLTTHTFTFVPTIDETTFITPVTTTDISTTTTFSLLNGDIARNVTVNITKDNVREGLMTRVYDNTDDEESNVGRKGATTVEDTVKPPPKFDIPTLLELISNLTADYDWNLTRRFNESLHRYNIPTCEPVNVTVTTENIFENATVVSKCFVCGLTTPGIPYDSRCADAFSGDFIPLVPVDSQARASISRYRKYCRYLDVPRYLVNPYEPRSVFGRFTGGCSVRWVDLTGVYMQRACRNSRRPVTGKHFASKRMAKLEKSLTGVENGCIISPMATLIPVSRGISLYARFHACVCTGEWCNRALRKEHLMTNLQSFSMFLILFVVS